MNNLTALPMENNCLPRLPVLLQQCRQSPHRPYRQGNRCFLPSRIGGGSLARPKCELNLIPSEPWFSCQAPGIYHKDKNGLESRSSLGLVQQSISRSYFISSRGWGRRIKSLSTHSWSSPDNKLGGRIKKHTVLASSPALLAFGLSYKRHSESTINHTMLRYCSTGKHLYNVISEWLVLLFSFPSDDSTSDSD